MTFIGLNRMYARAINSDDDDALNDVFLHIIALYPKSLRSKLYSWNRLRGRSFYAALSRFVISRIREAEEAQNGDMEVLDRAMDMVHMLETQDGKKDTYRSFVWNLTKKAPVLTRDTVPYLSTERVHNILTLKRVIYTDDVTKPLVDEVMALRRQTMTQQEVQCVQE